MRSPNRRRTPRGLAFSLLELLIVIAIIVVLAALTIPAVTSLSTSRSLATATQNVLEKMSLARQHAMANGRRVRWELVKVDKADGNGQEFRALRLVEFNQGQWKQVGRWQLLPDQVRVNPDTTRTQLLTSIDVIDVEVAGKAYTSVPFLGITFLPDGTTTLPVVSTGNPPPLLTLDVPRGEVDASGNYPNWAAFVVNPVTGVATSYRP